MEWFWVYPHIYQSLSHRLIQVDPNRFDQTYIHVMKYHSLLFRRNKEKVWSNEIKRKRQRERGEEYVNMCVYIYKTILIGVEIESNDINILWVSEWLSEWVSEWTNEMNEWMLQMRLDLEWLQCNSLLLRVETNERVSSYDENALLRFFHLL
jgi:hypothetical protein